MHFDLVVHSTKVDRTTACLSMPHRGPGCWGDTFDAPWCTVKMVKASKRSRPESAAAEPSDVAEPENKRSRAARRQAQPQVQQDVVEIQAPGRDRREVMADVARR